MRFDPGLLSNLPKKYEEELRLAPVSEVAEIVKANLDGWVRRGITDIDELLYSGQTVGRFHPDGIDQYISNWLELNSSPLHLDVAASFLWGYWPYTSHIYSPLLKRFVAAAPSLPRESSVYGSVMLALSAAYAHKKMNLSQEEFQEGRQLLRHEKQILRETGIQPGILGVLDDVE